MITPSSVRNGFRQRSANDPPTNFAKDATVVAASRKQWLPSRWTPQKERCTPRRCGQNGVRAERGAAERGEDAAVAVGGDPRAVSVQGFCCSAGGAIASSRAR